eukprot:9356865-Prorocentrum_lima.AAC.1
MVTFRCPFSTAFCLPVRARNWFRAHAAGSFWLGVIQIAAVKPQGWCCSLRVVQVGALAGGALLRHRRLHFRGSVPLLGKEDALVGMQIPCSLLLLALALQCFLGMVTLARMLADKWKPDASFGEKPRCDWGVAFFRLRWQQADDILLQGCTLEGLPPIAH